MSEQKVGFLRIEDAKQEELEQVADTIENELPDNYNIIVMNKIEWADPEDMIELFISMFHFIEANCFKDKAEAIKTVNPNQENLKPFYEGLE